MRSLVTLAFLLVATSAHADKQECIAQSEQAQQARTDNHLTLARDLFKACAAAECPQSVRNDCEKSFDEVDRATPSIVVIARAGDRDVTDARVLVDGALAAGALDGHALAVDPGPHMIRIESADGRVLATREVVAHVSEKNRALEIPVTIVADTSRPVDESVRHHTVAPWIVMGVGLAGLVTGGVLFALGQSDITTSKQNCAQETNGSLVCVPAMTTPDGQNRSSLNTTGTTLSNAGIITLGVGGAALIAGIIWHFVEPTGPRRVSLVPLASPSLAGLSLTGTF